LGVAIALGVISVGYLAFGLSTAHAPGPLDKNPPNRFDFGSVFVTGYANTYFAMDTRFSEFRREHLKKVLSYTVRVASDLAANLNANPDQLLTQYYFGTPVADPAVVSGVNRLPLSEETLHRIRWVTQNIKNALTKQITFRQPSIYESLTQSAFASTVFQNPTIEMFGNETNRMPFSDPEIAIYDSFWNLSYKRQVAVILHELSHEIENGTEDYGYISSATAPNLFFPPTYDPAQSSTYFAIRGSTYLRSEELSDNGATFEQMFYSYISGNFSLYPEVGD
jgi:hypothetical protein